MSGMAVCLQFGWKDKSELATQRLEEQFRLHPLARGLLADVPREPVIDRRQRPARRLRKHLHHAGALQGVEIVVGVRDARSADAAPVVPEVPYRGPPQGAPAWCRCSRSRRPGRWRLSMT